MLESVDMIVLDIMFPANQPDGYEVCKMIRTKEELKEIPIYMFSAKTFDEDKEASKVVGANGFIEKPIPIEDLVALIDKVIKEKKE